MIYATSRKYQICQQSDYRSVALTKLENVFSI
jgi:hypothetical protein